MSYKFPAGGEGGASAFVELTDCPATIVLNGVVVGNDAGDALLVSGAIAVTEEGAVSVATTVLTDEGATFSRGVLITTGGATGIDDVGSGEIDIHTGYAYGGAAGLNTSGNAMFRSGYADVPGNVMIECGLSPTQDGSWLTVAAGTTTAPAKNGGDLYLVAGAGGEGGLMGAIHLTARVINLGPELIAANAAQNVTVGNVGPGGAAISIKRWIPITIDGNAGWIPHFGV